MKDQLDISHINNSQNLNKFQKDKKSAMLQDLNSKILRDMRNIHLNRLMEHTNRWRRLLEFLLQLHKKFPLNKLNNLRLQYHCSSLMDSLRVVYLH